MKNKKLRKRISEEHDDLLEKVLALEAFISSEKMTELTVGHQSLLKSQLSYMQSYLRTLKSRIRLLT